MKFVYDLTGADPIERDMAIYGAAVDIVEGAAVMRGATGETDHGLVVVAVSATADIVGVLNELHDYSVSGDATLSTGTNWVRRKVIINPFAVYRAQYDTTDDMDVASTSTVTVTITSLEDDIDGGWLLGDDSAGAYGTGSTGSLLQFIVTSASGSCTTKAATGWTSSTDAIKILPVMHQLFKINTAADKIGSDAAAGSGRAAVLENYVEAQGIPLQPLDPTKHAGVTMFFPKIYSDIRFLNMAWSPID